MSRSSSRSPCRAAQSGHTLLIVVLMVTVMIISSTVAFQVWNTVSKREKEEELIYRGRQYAMAIYLYRKNRGTYPTDLKQLEEKGPKGEYLIRQLYKDPITGGDFGLVYAGPNGAPIPDEQLGGDPQGASPAGSPASKSPTGSIFPSGASTAGGKSAFGTPTTGGLGIMGVHSKSSDTAIGPSRWRDLDRYSEWLFLVTDIAVIAPGTPGQPGQQGVPGQAQPGRGATPGGIR